MTSGAYNRDKGARFERDIRETLRKLYGEKVRKYRQASSHDVTIPDIGTDDDTMVWDIECKCQGRLAVTAYMRQAEQRCRDGKIPVVWARLLRLGPGQDEYIIMRPKAFMAICEALDEEGLDLKVAYKALHG